MPGDDMVGVMCMLTPYRPPLSSKPSSEEVYAVTQHLFNINMNLRVMAMMPDIIDAIYRPNALLAYMEQREKDIAARKERNQSLIRERQVRRSNNHQPPPPGGRKQGK